MGSRARVVYDFYIFWRAIFSPASTSARCVQLFRDGAVLHFISDETLSEIRDVLTRPESLHKFSAISPDDVEVFIARLLERSTLVRNVPRTFKLPRDPKDEAYVDLASFVEADYIVTNDKDLLDLMTGFDDASKEFRRRFRTIKIVNPNEFLQIVIGDNLSLLP